MRILFFGTPAIAARTLESLHHDGFEICAAVSQPDRPKGRSQEIEPTPVKQIAITLNIPIFQPETIRENALEEILNELNPDVIVVIAYGKILPKYILQYPKFGCVNIHASLLPKYRGAAPIQWALICGETTTGITTMLMDEGIDTGAILCRYPLEIKENATAGTLFEEMGELSCCAIRDTLLKLQAEEVIPKAQDESAATYAPSLTKEMGKIDFNKPAESVKNLIRGLNPWPVAYTFFKGKRLKIFSAETARSEMEPGYATENERGIEIGCADGSAVIVTELALEGKRCMDGVSFLKGHAIKEPIKLGGEN